MVQNYFTVYFDISNAENIAWEGKVISLYKSRLFLSKIVKFVVFKCKIGTYIGILLISIILKHKECTQRLSTVLISYFLEHIWYR